MSDRERTAAQQRRIVWGVSALSSSAIFGALLLFLLAFGRIGAAGAIFWAAGAGLVTLVVVATTGALFFRDPVQKQRSERGDTGMGRGGDRKTGG